VAENASCTSRFRHFRAPRRAEPRPYPDTCTAPHVAYAPAARHASSAAWGAAGRRDGGERHSGPDHGQGRAVAMAGAQRSRKAAKPTRGWEPRLGTHYRRTAR
jgi:hypothetical protein